MKTLSIYNLNNKDTYLSLFTEEVDSLLAQNIFRECGQAERQRIGFVPTKLDGMLASDANGDIILNVAIQKKTINKNQVNKLLEGMVERYKKETLEVNVPKTLLKEMKLGCEEEVLELTFPDEPKFFTVVFTKDQKVLVEAKGNVAETITSFIRKALGSLEITYLETDKPLSDLLDDWVKTDISTEFTLGEKVTLINPAGERAVLSKCPISDTKAAEYLKDGSYVEELSINYDGVVDFNLKEDFTLSGIKFDKEFLEDGDEGGNILIQVAELKNVVYKVVGLLKEEG